MYDTEFLERGPSYPIAFISIGMVHPESGKTYYLKATLTGSPSGLSSTATASFETPALGAPVLGDVSIEAGLDVARISVPLIDLGDGSDTVEGQAGNDTMMAFQALRRAYNIDVGPILAKARADAGGAIDVLATYRESRWRERKAQERNPVGLGAGIV
jgi:hypothetical protein